MKKVLVLAVGLASIALSGCSTTNSLFSNASLGDDFTKYKECSDKYDKLIGESGYEYLMGIYYSPRTGFCVEEQGNWNYDKYSFSTLYDLRSDNTIVGYNCGADGIGDCKAYKEYEAVREYYLGNSNQYYSGSDRIFTGS